MAIEGLTQEGLLISQPTYAAPATVHHQHAVCWRAVIAGAVAAAALSILLAILGAGFGLAIVSPWSASGVDAGTFGITAILWLSITQIIASGLGGFLSGRLRSRTPLVDQDEVYFRDTAHGFLTWSIALLVSAALFASTLGALVNGGVQAGAKLGGAAVASAGALSAGALSNNAIAGNDSDGYYIDSLFRKSSTTSGNNDAASAAHFGTASEVRRIFRKSLNDKNLASNDLTYLGTVVADRTGLSQQDAETRVKQAYQGLENSETMVKKTADKARKASAYTTLWAFIALLIGAFTASLAATWGGRYRDAIK